MRLLVSALVAVLISMAMVACDETNVSDDELPKADAGTISDSGAPPDAGI